MISTRGNSRGSIYDVASKAGVSIGTVSRVFNNRQDVSTETRQKVMQAAKRVRYMPKISARRSSIGLVVEGISSANQVGFISSMVATLAKQVASREAVLELLPMEDLDCVYRNYIQGIVAIVFGSGGPLDKIRNVPVVMLNNRRQAPNFHSIASDHAQGAVLGVNHLVKRGHRRIGFLEVSAGLWGAKERERGYRQALKAAGAEPEPGWVGYVEGQPLQQAVESVLASRPTALLICGEDLSLAVNEILLHRMKVKIPRELSVVSFETPIVSGLLTPPQTTIAQPWESLSMAAVDGVLSLIQGKSREPIDLLLPNTLIDRESVAPPAA